MVMIIGLMNTVEPLLLSPLLLSQPLSCRVFCPDGPVCMDGESPLLLSQPLSCRNKTLNAQGDSKRGSTVITIDIYFCLYDFFYKLL